MNFITIASFYRVYQGKRFSQFVIYVLLCCVDRTSKVDRSIVQDCQTDSRVGNQQARNHAGKMCFFFIFQHFVTIQLVGPYWYFCPVMETAGTFYASKGILIGKHCSTNIFQFLSRQYLRYGNFLRPQFESNFSRKYPYISRYLKFF